MPEPGFPCCEDYAATLDQSPEDGVSQSESVSAPAFVASPAIPARAEPAESKSRARFSLGSYVLLGLLVSCLSGLAVALVIQMRTAAERERELAATRLLSEEMIALMKEARGEAPAVAPQVPAVEAKPSMEIPSGAVAAPPVEAPKSPAADAQLPSEKTVDGATAAVGAPPQAAAAAAAPPLMAAAVAPPQAAPPVDPPPVAPAPPVDPPVAAPAPPSTVANADTASNSVARTSPAFFGTGTSLERLPYSASAVPGPATAATVDAPPAPPSVARQQPPRTAKAVRQKIETRRPVAAEAREKEVELDREPSSSARIAQLSQPPAPRSPSPESTTAFQKLASLPPAVRNALPLRPTIDIGWTKIERGMSRQQVRRLLGKPRSTERLKSAEFWFYAERSMFARGWVAFRESGGVIEWLTP